MTTLFEAVAQASLIEVSGFRVALVTREKSVVILETYRKPNWFCVGFEDGPLTYEDGEVRVVDWLTQQKYTLRFFSVQPIRFPEAP